MQIKRKLKKHTNPLCVKQNELEVLERGYQLIAMEKSEIIRLEKELKNLRSGSKAPMYLHATEMVDTYYSRLGLEGKSILTIIGSGDQVLDAIFHGAREVAGFDVNLYSVYITKLKIAAISNLSHAEFLKYFGSGTTPASLDYGLYLKFRGGIHGVVRDFFDSLYKYYKNNGSRMVKSSFFAQRHYTSPIGLVVGYLKSDANYQRMRKRLRAAKLDLVICNIVDLQSCKGIKGQRFDIVNLSNVPNFYLHKQIYLHRQIKGGDKMMIFHDSILVPLGKMLRKGGKIFYYRYTPKFYPNPVASRMPYASARRNVRKLRNSKEFKLSEMKFRSISLIDFKMKRKPGREFDSIVVLEKKE